MSAGGARPAGLREILPPDTRLAFPALRELRPHVADEAAFVRRVDVEQRPEGFRLVGVFDEPAAPAVAVAGFRVLHSLVRGRSLYVDDLSTVPEGRRRGHARALLDWLAAEGRGLGCATLHLDSGLGADRADAHRLYFSAGLRIVSLHFARELAG